MFKESFNEIIGCLRPFTLGDIVVRDENTIVFRAVRNADGQRLLIRVPASVESAEAAREYIGNDYEISQRMPPDAAVIPLALIADREFPCLIFPDSGGRFAHELKHIFRGNPDAWLHFGIQAANALAIVHDQGIVHNEIRPENMLVDHAAVRLFGFGSAALLLQERRRESDLSLLVDDRIAYISPEYTGRMSRGIDRRSDLYSMGVVLYQLLTGQLPLRGIDMLGWIHSHIAIVPIAPANQIPGLPEPVSQIVMKLLAKLPEERYQTARGLKYDLEHCLAELETQGSVAMFPLGQHDIPERLMFGDRLFGRDAEVASLCAAFAAAQTASRPQVMLVTGESGAGKTAIVRELRKPVYAAGGVFASGKFDQYQRGVPYATLVQAVRELVRQLLTLPDEAMARWQENISQSLGTIGRVVTEIVPEVELITGPQSPIPELPPVEARNRFNLAIARFIQVFARPRHPLCLFLDDMQWADSASLELLSSLIAAEDTGSLLLVLAFRDEVGPGHPFADFVAKLRSTGVPMGILVLGPLRVENVAELAASVLRRPRNQCDALARLIVERTLGNPFFVQEFLKALKRDRLLTFDPEAGAWTWDQTQVEAEASTDNVVAMLARTVCTIDPAALGTLQLASCFGNEFDLTSLCIISQKAAEEVGEHLHRLLRQEFILQAKGGESDNAIEGRYRFRHDQIQQAAYSLVPVEQRRRLHLKIGTLLLSGLSSSEREERAFDIAEQLNSGIDLITDPTERARALEINLAAARKARAAVAWNSALTFLESATKLLCDNPQQNDRLTVFALHRDRAECLFVTGREEAADEIFRTLLDQALSRADVAGINTLRVRLYSGSSRYDEAIAAGFAALRLFGIEVPEDAASIPDLLAEERRLLQEQLGDRTLEDMLNAPVMSDLDASAIMGLLGALPPSIYPRRPELFPLIAIRMLRYSVLYGNTADSCFAYSMYAMLLVGVFGDIPGGHSLSRMSIELNERLKDRRHRCTVLHVHANHINYWREPYERNIPFLDLALRATLETGDSAIAGHFCYQAAWQVLERELPLNQAEQALEQYAGLARKVGNETVQQIILLQIQLLKNMRGETVAPDSLDSDDFQEAAALATFEATGSNTGFFFYHVIRMIVAFRCGQYELALRCAESAAPNIGGALALPIETTYAMYRALSVAHAIHAGCAIRDEWTAMLEADTGKLRCWAENCPANFGFKYRVVEAERARLSGDLQAAMRLYDEAIESARSNVFLWSAAQASELAGSFCAGVGVSTAARAFRMGARELYDRIGARAGVQRLDRTAASLQPKAASVLVPEARSLDLTSVLLASQAMSREIELSSLLKALIRIVMLNAGADRGLLVRLRGHQKVVEVAARVEPDGQISARVAAEGAEALFPQMVVNYVIRTRERVLIGDVRSDQLFLNDPYFSETNARSMLCAPILKGESLAGLLYLENSVAASAFTAERLAVLDLLSSQAAISLENADLYRMVRQNEEHLRLAHEAAKSGTWEWDLQTGENVWSEELWSLYGLQAHSCEPSYEAWRQVVHPDDRARAEQVIGRAVRDGTELNVEFRVRDHGGKERWLLSLGRPFRNEEGLPRRVVGIVLDITGRKKAEEALRESEDQFRTLANAIPQLCWMANGDGWIFWYNQRWYEYTGKTPEQMEGWGWQSVHDPVTLPNVLERWRDSLASGEPFDMVFPLRGADGVFRPFLTRIMPVRDRDGNVARWFGTNTDISEQRRIEESLRYSSEQRRLALEVAEMGTWEYRFDTGTTLCDERCRNMFGLPAGNEFTYNESMACVHPDDRAAREAALKEAIAGINGGAYQSQFRVVWPDGSIHWIASLGRVHFRDEDAGRPAVSVMGVTFDITDRKAAEGALRESARQLALLADAMPQMVWTCHPDGSPEYRNRRWHEFLGLPEGTSDLKMNELFHRDDLKPMLEAWRSALASGQPYDFQGRLGDRRSCTWRWHLNRALPIHDEDGTLVKWVGTSTDIDDHKRLSEELEQRVESRTADLKRSLLEKELLLKEVHHRVKNNLQVICSLLSMQMECALSASTGEPMDTLVEPIREAYQRVQSMAVIHEQLYRSRTLADLDFGRYIESLAKRLYNAYCADPSRIRLELSVEPIHLTVDHAIPCGLILNELVSNALKYAFRGGPGGFIRVVFRRLGAERVELAVSDNGVGLPPGFDIAKVSSLGLRVVQALSQQLDANLRITNSEGANMALDWRLSEREELQRVEP